MALRPGDDYDRDLMDIIPERYDADADSHQARAGHRLRSWVTIGIAVVAVGAIVAAGLHFVGGKRGGGMGVPVIKADDRPIKIRPDDRGGMQVPNQDKLVYERMEQGAESEANKVERLMPVAEAPKAPPRQPAAAPEPPVQIPLQPQIQQPAAPAAKPAPAVAAPKAPEAAPPKPAPVPKVVAQDQVITPSQVASVPVAPPPVPVAPPAPAAKAAPAGGDYVIQLGAVRAQDLAEKEWTRIQRTNSDLLGGLRPDIVRVELEGKGVFWRVRAAPLSETSARQICAELSQRSQGCIVARK